MGGLRVEWGFVNLGSACSAKQGDWGIRSSGDLESLLDVRVYWMQYRMAHQLNHAMPGNGAYDYADWDGWGAGGVLNTKPCTKP